MSAAERALERIRTAFRQEEWGDDFEAEVEAALAEYDGSAGGDLVVRFTEEQVTVLIDSAPYIDLDAPSHKRLREHLAPAIRRMSDALAEHQARLSKTEPVCTWQDIEAIGEEAQKHGDE